MGRIKNKIYDLLVKKNGRVWYEYERYVREHMEEHRLHRLRQIRVLIKLNWFYRVKKGNTPYLYWDVPLEPVKATYFEDTESIAEIPVKFEEKPITKPEEKSVVKSETRPVSKVEEKVAVKSQESNAKLPYLCGAESCINPNLKDPHFMAKRLKNYDIISFDIFDTLIFRPFCSPTDLFILVGEKLHINNFKKIRTDAEKKARDISYVLYGTREITLNDIYVQVERETGISAQEGMKVELECEKKYCFANPYMQIIFNILKGQGCKIILTSDMYLSSEQLMELLDNCGYGEYERIFVSCEYGSGKGGNGNIYKIIQEIYGSEKRICHVGDNYKNDILIARDNKWDAIHFPNVHDVGRKYRATYTGMSELWGSIYGALVNIKLHSGLEKYSEAFEYGYIYGGLYVFGFCNWIYEYIKKNQIDKILFLSRDGDIYRRVFSLLFNDVDSEYVYWSRYPSIICCAEQDRHDFINRFIRHRLNDVEPMRLDAILHIAKIDFLIDKLSKYRLRADAIFQKEFVGRLEELVIDNWDEIIQSYSKEKEDTESYLINVIGDSKKIAIVDVGWLGSGPLAIKNILEKVNSECKVECLCAASYATPPSQNLALLMNDTINCYIFNEFINRNHKDYHLNANNHCNNLFFEIFTQATSPSLEGIHYYNDKLRFDYGLPEVENYNLLREMHLGIVEFAQDYKKHFGDERWLCNVSGYDAYIPFRLLTQDLSIIKRIFGDYVISRNIGYDSSKNTMETLKAILGMRGL